jgi:hypothetical protein
VCSLGVQPPRSSRLRRSRSAFSRSPLPWLGLGWKPSASGKVSRSKTLPATRPSKAPRRPVSGEAAEVLLAGAEVAAERTVQPVLGLTGLDLDDAGHRPVAVEHRGAAEAELDPLHRLGGNQRRVELAVLGGVEGNAVEEQQDLARAQPPHVDPRHAFVASAHVDARLEAQHLVEGPRAALLDPVPVDHPARADALDDRLVLAHVDVVLERLPARRRGGEQDEQGQQDEGRLEGEHEQVLRDVRLYTTRDQREASGRGAERLSGRSAGGGARRPRASPRAPPARAPPPAAPGAPSPGIAAPPSRPSGVSRAPPPARPPVAVSTTGAPKQLVQVVDQVPCVAIRHAPSSARRPRSSRAPPPPRGAAALPGPSE